jgi:transcriptional regulator with XRE-family HTH domain
LVKRRRSDFGVELGRLLTERRVSLRELSRRTGLARSTLQRYTSGERIPEDDATVELIAAALETNVEELVEWQRRRVVARLGQEPRLVRAIYVHLVRPARR